MPCHLMQSSALRVCVWRKPRPKKGRKLLQTTQLTSRELGFQPRLDATQRIKAKFGLRETEVLRWRAPLEPEGEILIIYRREGRAELSNTVAMRPKWLFKFKLIIKYKFKFRSSGTRATFQELNNHMWPVATILDGADVEHLHRRWKPWWIVLSV